MFQTSRLRLRPAGEPDLEITSEILSEAAGCLVGRGEPLWRPDELALYYERAGFERHSEGALGPFTFLRYQKRLR